MQRMVSGWCGIAAGGVEMGKTAHRFPYLHTPFPSMAESPSALVKTPFTPATPDLAEVVSEHRGRVVLSMKNPKTHEEDTGSNKLHYDLSYAQVDESKRLVNANLKLG